MRARDALGRPVDASSPAAVEPVSDEPLPPPDAIALARQLLSTGRAFSAHEVLEASWKAAPPQERALWQGLAQVCVGLTHLQRGNRVGAARLLRRGAGQLEHRQPSYGVDVPRVRAEALERAEAIEDGRETGLLTL